MHHQSVHLKFWQKAEAIFLHDLILGLVQDVVCHDPFMVIPHANENVLSTGHEIQVYQDLLTLHMEAGTTHHTAGPHHPDPQVKLAVLLAAVAPELKSILDLSSWLSLERQLPRHQGEPQLHVD